MSRQPLSAPIGDAASSVPAAGRSRRRLLVATRSTHKLRELRELLALDDIELVSLEELGIPGDPVEDGLTFETNAAIKARFGLRASGLPTLADDSGIEVDALDGAPGVRTRRLCRRGRHRYRQQHETALGSGGPAGGAPRCPLRVRPGAGTPRRRGSARWRPGHQRPRHLPRPDRHRATRPWRVRLRPDLRTRRRATGRPNPWPVDAGREARHLAPRPGRSTHGSPSRHPPVLRPRPARAAARPRGTPATGRCRRTYACWSYGWGIAALKRHIARWSTAGGPGSCLFVPGSCLDRARISRRRALMGTQGRILRLRGIVPRPRASGGSPGRPTPPAGTNPSTGTTPPTGTNPATCPRLQDAGATLDFGVLLGFGRGVGHGSGSEPGVGKRAAATARIASRSGTCESP